MFALVKPFNISPHFHAFKYWKSAILVPMIGTLMMLMMPLVIAVTKMEMEMEMGMEMGMGMEMVPSTGLEMPLYHAYQLLTFMTRMQVT